ncbi:MAG: acyl-ACP--UDP-N-acetylglucosamine O-acyltransferase [Kiritimatiellia bacterium]
MRDIHSSAVIEKGAELADGVRVGAYSVVGPAVRIGEGTEIMSHVVLAGHTTIGSKCRVFPFACIGTETQDLKYTGAVSFVEIGDRSVLREYVTVNSPTNEGEVTRVGRGCFLMAYSHVAHACDVGDEVIMANAGTLAGHVKVEKQAIIGGLCGVHQFVHVGRLSMIGGCTKLSQDAPPFMIVDGRPAAVRGINSIGLKRRGMNAEVRKSLKEAYRLLYRSGLSTGAAIEKIRSGLDANAEVEHLISFIEGSERGIIKNA